MYFLTMYNISDKQKGIQSLHAVVEYGLQYFNTPEYQHWARHNKTVIVLDGGTSNLTGTNFYDLVQDIGSMEQHISTLKKNGIDLAYFNEPDLNNSTSAVAFLVDEKVWNREKYPTPEITVEKAVWYTTPAARAKAQQDAIYGALKEAYGEKVAFLRTFLSNFRLA